MQRPLPLVDRHLSWLSFNERVLQEAGDPTHPLLERLRFLAIFSSNLDEFFRVRVPPLYALRDGNLLDAIRRVVHRQQLQFGKHYLEEILPALRERGIEILDETAFTDEQKSAMRDYWNQRVCQRIEPCEIETTEPVPFLYDRQLYMVVVLDNAQGERRHAIVDVPTRFEPRFVELPPVEGRRCFAFLDDVLRLHLPELFPDCRVAGIYAVKLTRDADLRIEDEFSGDLLQKIREGLRHREKGMPSRLLYDPALPLESLELLRQRLKLFPESLIPGWRYHNFSDFLNFRNPGIGGLEYAKLSPPRHPELESATSLFEAIDERDRMLHYPYQSFDDVIRFLTEAANDSAVTSIHITLYRLAPHSQAVRALVEAARNGKEVTAFVEMKARFNEEANFLWADELRNAGAKVVHSLPGVKVHCKMCLVTRRKNGRERLYAYLSSGNFNEVTARVYTDHALFTADTRITHEVQKVFAYLAAERYPGRFNFLLVAPFNMRQHFTEMIDEEIRNAKAGKRAYIILKLNNLEDPQMIEKLCEAGEAGVELRLVVRSICCLPPEGLEPISIVGRFLEHGRIYIFHNGGDARYFIGSADWMTRNLSRRVEVVFPIFDETIREEIRAIVETHLQDNVNARILDVELSNRFRHTTGPQIRSQMEIFKLLQ